MASGQTLVVFTPQANMPTLGAFATIDTRNSRLVLDFDASTDESAVFRGVMPRNYAGGGITLQFYWSAAATANTGVLRAAFRRVQDDAEDLDTTAQTYDYNTTEDTAPSVVGEVAYASITFTDGADMDSVTAGDYFILRVSRNPTTGGTDVTGDAKICKVSIVGIGMRSHVGIASKMFRSLSEEGINIQMISTSEIKTSVVIDEKYMELAVRALHKAFDLDQA